MTSESRVKALDNVFSSAIRSEEEWAVIYDKYLYVTKNLTYFDNLCVLRAIFLSGDTCLISKYLKLSFFSVGSSPSNEPLYYDATTDLRLAVLEYDIRPFKCAIAIKCNLDWMDYFKQSIRQASKVSTQRMDAMCKEFMIALTNQTLYEACPSDRVLALSMLRELGLLWIIHTVIIPQFDSNEWEAVEDELILLNEKLALSGPESAYVLNLRRALRNVSIPSIVALEKSLMTKVYKCPTIIRKCESTALVFALPYQKIQASKDPHLQYITTTKQYKVERLEYHYGINTSKLDDVDFALQEVESNTCTETLTKLVNGDLNDSTWSKIKDLLWCGADPRLACEEIVKLLHCSEPSDIAFKIIEALDVNFITDPVFILAVRDVCEAVDDALTARARQLI